jgi:hypothetical protein
VGFNLSINWTDILSYYDEFFDHRSISNYVFTSSIDDEKIHLDFNIFDLDRTTVLDYARLDEIENPESVELSNDHVQRNVNVNEDVSDVSEVPLTQHVITHEQQNTRRYNPHRYNYTYRPHEDLQDDQELENVDVDDLNYLQDLEYFENYNHYGLANRDTISGDIEQIANAEDSYEISI